MTCSFLSALQSIDCRSLQRPVEGMTCAFLSTLQSTGSVEVSAPTSEWFALFCRPCGAGSAKSGLHLPRDEDTSLQSECHHVLLYSETCEIRTTLGNRWVKSPYFRDVNSGCKRVKTPKSLLRPSISVLPYFCMRSWFHRFYCITIYSIQFSSIYL
jgi:hypothetical protein